jgi:hypothetical protein
MPRTVETEAEFQGASLLLEQAACDYHHALVIAGYPLEQVAEVRMRLRKAAIAFEHARAALLEPVVTASSVEVTIPRATVDAALELFANPADAMPIARRWVDGPEGFLVQIASMFPMPLSARLCLSVIAGLPKGYRPRPALSLVGALPKHSKEEKT